MVISQVNGNIALNVLKKGKIMIRKKYLNDFLKAFEMDCELEKWKIIPARELGKKQSIFK